MRKKTVMSFEEIGRKLGISTALAENTFYDAMFKLRYQMPPERRAEGLSLLTAIPEYHGPIPE